MSPTGQRSHHSQPSLSELPLDELKAYSKKIGLSFSKDAQPGELLRLIRQRQELLLELDHQALLDICVWARKPVRQSASKEELAAEIAQIHKMRFKGLSEQGLYALCRLRGALANRSDDAETMMKTLKKAEPWSHYIQRKRRRWVGSLISNMITSGAPKDAERQKYQFLPENDASLKERIEEEGVVSGITRKIKGAADDYVRQKLDEIEVRIDRKLDEIDGRLAEWRDREIHNRLRIIKITLIATIIVALLSLGYDYLRRPGQYLEPPQPVVNPLGEPSEE